jgi:hypothetical protein
VLGKQPKTKQTGKTRREQLADWLTSKDNPYFARATVNRVWAILFGYGLVDPVDDFGKHNLASHPKILNELAADFAKNNFNLRRLFRILANTQAYQLSSQVTKSDANHPHLFHRMAVKSLTAEQIYDCLDIATCKVEAATQSGRTSMFRINQEKRNFLAKFEAPTQSVTEF